MRSHQGGHEGSSSPSFQEGGSAGIRDRSRTPRKRGPSPARLSQAQERSQDARPKLRGRPRTSRQLPGREIGEGRAEVLYEGRRLRFEYRRASEDREDLATAIDRAEAAIRVLDDFLARRVPDYDLRLQEIIAEFRRRTAGNYEEDVARLGVLVDPRTYENGEDLSRYISSYRD